MALDPVVWVHAKEDQPGPLRVRTLCHLSPLISLFCSCSGRGNNPKPKTLAAYLPKFLPKIGFLRTREGRLLMCDVSCHKFSGPCWFRVLGSRVLFFAQDHTYSKQFRDSLLIVRATNRQPHLKTGLQRQTPSHVAGQNLIS